MKHLIKKNTLKFQIQKLIIDTSLNRLVHTFVLINLSTVNSFSTKINIPEEILPYFINTKESVLFQAFH